MVSPRCSLIPALQWYILNGDNGDILKNMEIVNGVYNLNGDNENTIC
jgi:hypothetical protein